MATYMGFKPANTTPYYFISYSTEDSDRAAEYCRRMRQDNRMEEERPASAEVPAEKATEPAVETDKKSTSARKEVRGYQRGRATPLRPARPQCLQA